MNKSFYELSALSLRKKEVNFEEFRGKVVLVVNTASKCGFTPQYEGLEKLYEKYREDGLVILGFPCNQFARQEPGDAASIEQGCMLNYGVSFPMFDKIDVNGKTAHPVYQWLKTRFGGFGSKRIKWNFTKFLLDREGNPVKRFPPVKKPEDLDGIVAGLLSVEKAKSHE
jgi:glutathione peroxidase